jgi:hypothetical protein
MRSLFRPTLQWFHGVPDDFDGIDVDDGRATLSAVLDDPRMLTGWRITVDDQHPGAYPADSEYVKRLEHGRGAVVLEVASTRRRRANDGLDIIPHTQQQI